VYRSSVFALASGTCAFGASRELPGSRSHPLGWRRFAVTSVMPEAKSTNERIGLVSLAATRRKLFQLVDVATSEHDVLGPEGGDQARDHIRDVIAPFLFAVTLQSATADIVLEGCFSV